MHDEEFLQQFAAGTLAEFHHADHVRMAWLYLQRYPVLEAIAKFTADLKHFAAVNGQPERYHETITWAYLLLIHERKHATPTKDWHTFAEQHPDLLTWENNLVARSYRRETLHSERARQLFVFPDGGATNGVTAKK